MDVNALAALWSAARGPRPGARRLPPGRRFLLAALLCAIGILTSLVRAKTNGGTGRGPASPPLRTGPARPEGRDAGIGENPI